MSFVVRGEIAMHRAKFVAASLPLALFHAWWNAFLDAWDFVGEAVLPQSGLAEIDNFVDAGCVPNAEIAGGDF